MATILLERLLKDIELNAAIQVDIVIKQYYNQ